ncbi:MAG: O-sialoglycoprotein endopeptidase [Clostridiales bacterium]|nr:O-sialoglycoprotein endopeptidase [Clostridiales bacterium]
MRKAMLPKAVKISALSVSAKPTDSVGSYMPVFKAGVSIAKSLAAALNVPCYETSHQRGHLQAALLNRRQMPSEYLALHLSGGTTDLLIISSEKIIPIANSLDLHAGQLIDRIGVRLGLQFPSGPDLETLAKRGVSTGKYCVNLKDLNCHLSGAEAQAIRDVLSGLMSKEDIAAEVFDLLARTVFQMIYAAKKETGLSEVLIFGGVASSDLFRNLLKNQINVHQSGLNVMFGLPEYSGDNAVGVALIGAIHYFNKL